MGKQHVIDLANGIPIFEVLEQRHAIYVPREGQSFKGECPFGFEHVDGGIANSFRTYPATNSAHCFAGHGYFDTVGLEAMGTGKPRLKAAYALLDARNMLRDRSYKERWSDLETARSTPASGRLAVEALHVAIRHAGRENAYLDPTFTATLAAWLNALEDVMAHLAASPATDPHVALTSWLEKAKRALLAPVGEAVPGAGERTAALVREPVARPGDVPARPGG